MPVNIEAMLGIIKFFPEEGHREGIKTFLDIYYKMEKPSVEKIFNYSKDLILGSNTAMDEKIKIFASLSDLKDSRSVKIQNLLVEIVENAEGETLNRILDHIQRNLTNGFSITILMQSVLDSNSQKAKFRIYKTIMNAAESTRDSVPDYIREPFDKWYKTYKTQSCQEIYTDILKAL